jgi:hypothetical protein
MKPGPCPSCGSTAYVRERCSACRLPKLEEALLGGQGHILNAAVQIDMDLADGFTMTLEDLSVQEYAAFRMLRAERLKRQLRSK